MKTFLFDVNVLLALTWPHHVHHNITHQWWVRSKMQRWASCTITQLGFVRLSCHPRIAATPASPAQAVALLRGLVGRTDHEFWTELPNGSDAGADVGLRWLESCLTHAHVSDAYLAQLARHHQGRFATLDRTLVSRHSDIAELVQ